MDRFLIERRSLAAEFLTRQFDGGEQSGQATHLTVQGRRRPLADAQGGQLRIGPGALRTTSPAGACLGTAVERGDPNDQTAEQSQFQPSRLRGTS